MATNREDEPVEISTLTHRPKHLESIGLLTVEITHMERAISELFGTIIGIPFFLGEAIYFTANSGIARMDIVRNTADLVLNPLPGDLQKVLAFIERGKAIMGKRHSVIHSFWMLAEDNPHIRREKLGEFRNKRVATVSLAELHRQISDAQKLTHDVYAYCSEFGAAHPFDPGSLASYWNDRDRLASTTKDAT